ncbi:GNAT family N-acetyltransferase [Actinoalloteichus hymeniacidonis]|uniref:Acetyltransferase (GNAT) family protein n=1 Tax=Actinoalloteichus hymeniacidonis TaxID=340345 RepID=A0AAC9HNX2_9PSEU|nr:GNAT family N-acetyltransferase [Actinoalloteichus hymeniacidonis]AOS62877.1 acetyltransferase (GNAT) family protein [Actinoalloteichus hymeniacidonis]MBB5909090.1 ribosomal protein S18 acetylase RimI-like enzyme [Actinoalloteichus hymeniacidonis]
MRWRLRRAGLDDAAALGRVNVLAWQRVYRGLMPAALLDGLSRVDQTPNWRETLGWPEPHADFLAVLPGDEPGAAGGPGVSDRAGAITDSDPDGWIGAYATVGPVREADDAHPTRRTGELMSLYAAPRWLRTGAGRLTHDAGLTHLTEAGFEHVVVWVMADNAEGRAFYEAVGWSCDEVVRPLELPGFSLPEIRYSRPLPVDPETGSTPATTAAATVEAG